MAHGMPPTSAPGVNGAAAAPRRGAGSPVELRLAEVALEVCGRVQQGRDADGDCRHWAHGREVG